VHGAGGAVAETTDQPLGVVGLDEAGNGLAQLIDRVMDLDLPGHGLR
jgi:hypothetical protein